MNEAAMNEAATKNGNQPAHPLKIDDGRPGGRTYSGLSIREHFAGLALQGILANPAMMTPPAFVYDPNVKGPFEPNQVLSVETMPKLEIIQPDHAVVAAMAVKWADALLEALERNR